MEPYWINQSLGHTTAAVLHVEGQRDKQCRGEKESSHGFLGRPATWNFAAKGVFGDAARKGLIPSSWSCRPDQRLESL